MSLSHLKCATLCALFVCFCVPLFTQEYVVTASRNLVDVLDSPANTTVITAEEIEKSGKANLVQVLKTVPTLQITSLSSDAQAQISMRGFGENAFGRVLVMIDGRSINNPDMSGTNLLAVPLSAIERIEIVDGPSSALYGNNAVGGVINIITKESAEKLSGSVALSAGSAWTFNPQLSLNASSENAGVSLAVDHYKTDGWRERTGVKATNALVNSYFDLSDTITLKPSFFFTDSFYELPGSLTKEQFEENPQQALEQNDDSSMLSLGGNIALYWDLLSNLHLFVPVNYEYKASEANLHDTYFTVGDGPYPYFSDTNQHRVNLDPRVNYLSEISENIFLSIDGGVDSGLILYERISFLDISRDKESDKMNTTQYFVAPYIQTKLDFSSVTVSATVRFDSVFLDMEHSSNVSDSNWYHAPVYAMEAVYRPVEEFSVYARGSSLFRYPFLDEVINVYVKDPINDNLLPETGFNVEVGFKTDFGDIFSATLSGYFMPMENEIWFNPTTYENENYLDTLRAGGSIAMQTSPTNFLKARVSAVYTHAVFSAGEFKDKKVPLAPAFSAHASMDFSFVGITLTPDIQFKSESFQGGDNANIQDTIPSYFLLGFAASYNFNLKTGHLMLIVHAQNLLDTVYSPYTYYSSSKGAAFYPAEGRSFSISGRYSF